MAGDQAKTPVIDLTISDTDRTPRKSPKTNIIELDDEPEVIAVKLQPVVPSSQVTRPPLSTARTISVSNTGLERRARPPKRSSSLVFTVPDEPKAKSSAAPVKKCPICLGALESPSSTICGHVFCTPCIKAAFNSNKMCPVCRKRLKPKDIHAIYF